MTDQTMPDRWRARARQVVEAPALGDLVEVTEARIGDIFPHLDEASKEPAKFMRRLLCASVTIDGVKLDPEMIDDMGMRTWQAMQPLIPVVLEMNGMQPPGEAPKKD